MPELSLDFASAQRPLARPKPYLGVALLLAGALALATIAWNNNEQTETNSALSARRDQLAARLQRRAPQESMPAELVAQFDQADAAFAQIMTPWDELFRALESGKSGDVALLSLTADTAKKQFALSGEAKDFAALTKFTETLSANPAFLRVALSNHRLSEGALPVVVKFDLLLAWRRNGESQR